MKKLSLALFLLVSASASVQAQTVADALQTCGQVQNSLKRLVCYDDIVKNLNAYGGLTDLMAVPAPLPARGTQGPAPVNPRPAQAAPYVAAPAAASPSASPESQFGLEHRKNESEDRIEKLFASVTKVGKSNKNKVTVTLDNGQVWRQTHSDALRIKVNDRVYVERGVMGAFFMGKESAKKRMKVARVK